MMIPPQMGAAKSVV